MISTTQHKASPTKMNSAISCCINATLAAVFFNFFQTSEFPQLYLMLALLSFGCAIVVGRDLVSILMGRARSANKSMIQRILPYQDIARSGNYLEKITIFVLPLLIAFYQWSASKLASDSMIHSIVFMPSLLMIALMQASVHSLKIPPRVFHTLSYLGSFAIHTLIAIFVCLGAEFDKGSPFMAVILVVMVQGALIDGYSMVQVMSGMNPGRNPRILWRFR